MHERFLSHRADGGSEVIVDRDVTIPGVQPRPSVPAAPECEGRTGGGSSKYFPAPGGRATGPERVRAGLQRGRGSAVRAGSDAEGMVVCVCAGNHERAAAGAADRGAAGERPKKALADAGFYSNENVRVLEERGIDGYLPDPNLARELNTRKRARTIGRNGCVVRN
jgi:hypothetical protein